MRKSKARIVVELVGPSDAVLRVVEEMTLAANRLHTDVKASFPEPCVIIPILRNRKKAAPKPERKARKANSQQPPLEAVRIVPPAIE